VGVAAIIKNIYNGFQLPEKSSKICNYVDLH